MDYEEYMQNLDLEDDSLVPVAGDELTCPACNIKLVGGVCPNCGITKEKIEADEDEYYERRRERR
jgi:rubrerythrin